MSLSQYWHIIVWPAMVLVFYVLAWNLLGDALRDHMDPRTGSGMMEH
jgi:ABC-type dipeptide/oligopeptide/nickel transport system permease subunit